MVRVVARPAHRGGRRTFDEAIDDLVQAAREYAEDWNDHLLLAPNHRGNWGLVQLVELSTVEQLRNWVLGSAE